MRFTSDLSLTEICLAKIAQKNNLKVHEVLACSSIQNLGAGVN